MIRMVRGMGTTLTLPALSRAPTETWGEGKMLPPEIAAWAYHQEEMAKILRITVATLKGRISRGTNHPPCQPWVKGEYIFPKDQFGNWARTKAAVIYEVRSA